MCGKLNLKTIHNDNGLVIYHIKLKYMYCLFCQFFFFNWIRKLAFEMRIIWFLLDVNAKRCKFNRYEMHGWYINENGFIITIFTRTMNVLRINTTSWSDCYLNYAYITSIRYIWCIWPYWGGQGIIINYLHIITINRVIQPNAILFLLIVYFPKFNQKQFSAICIINLI